MTLAVEEARAGFARRAETLHERGDSEGALRLLTQGARRFPGDVTALVVLAQVCRESGREAEARDWVRAALRLDPGCPAARAADAEKLRPVEARRPLAQAAAEATDTAGEPASASAPITIAPAPSVSPPFAAAEAGVDASAPFQPEARIIPRKPATVVPSPFTFPEDEEEEELEIDENSAPHIATVTLAEIYLQQGLKEQAAQIYRQLLEQQSDDHAVRERLQEILREIEGP